MEELSCTSWFKVSKITISTCCVKGSPQKNPITQIIPITIVFFDLKLGLKSRIPLRMVSTMANCESNPNVNNIAKNKNDQNGAARKKNKVKHLALQEVIFY